MLAELLVCPLWYARLHGVACTGRCHVFAVNDGAADLTPIPPPDPLVQDRWSLWEQLQASGSQAYEIDPPSSLRVGQRPDAEAFAAFSDLRGLVLDVGCGVQALPSYGEGFDGRLVGVAPLRGERVREFAFLQAVAGYLPFRDCSFNRVLFATSIDRVFVPEFAAAEACRVAKPGGWVCVWFGEVPGLGILERVRQWLRPPAEMHIRTLRTEMTFGFRTGRPTLFVRASGRRDGDRVARTGWVDGADGRTAATRQLLRTCRPRGLSPSSGRVDMRSCQHGAA